MLIAQYLNTKTRKIVGIRVDIPRDFGTVKQRAAKAAAQKPKLEDKNAFTRLLDDQQIGDDD
jgi:hypothetical protein